MNLSLIRFPVMDSNTFIPAMNSEDDVTHQ